MSRKTLGLALSFLFLGVASQGLGIRGEPDQTYSESGFKLISDPPSTDSFIKVSNRGTDFWIELNNLRMARDEMTLEAHSGDIDTYGNLKSESSVKELAELDIKLYASYLLSPDQFHCLDHLWTRESRWRWDALNKTSGAYGIPQALPGWKMKSSGDDWQTNPITQVNWGLKYIERRYSTPCNAWAHSEKYNWY